LEEGPDPLGVVLELALAGEQAVAVEVDPIVLRPEDPVVDAALLEIIGLIGDIGAEGVDLRVQIVGTADFALSSPP
jgi:hypothetical protein